MGALTDPGTSTTPTSPLLERLLTRGWEFDFFQAVWLLERCAPDRTAVGGRGPVADEPIRFRPDVALGFPATDVRRISPAGPATGEGPVYRIDVTFMGLCGVSSPLPLHYAVDILRAVEPYQASSPEQSRGVAPDAAQSTGEGTDSAPTRDFLDVFHHRLLSLFYRSWTKYRYDVVFGMPGRDTITEYLKWLIGCQRGYDEAVLGLSPVRLLRYAGLLTHHPRPAVGLEGMLCDYWSGLPVKVAQCVGRWVALAAADLNALGAANSRLGVDLTVGEQVYDLSGAFTVTLGPTNWETYLLFLPGEWGHEQTRSLVRFYCSDPLSFSIEIKLYAGEIPQVQLTSDDEAGRLGFTSWIGTEESPETSVAFLADEPALNH